MNEIDFLIPLFIDHNDRIENFKNVVMFLKKCGATSIHVEEHYTDIPRASHLFVNEITYTNLKIKDTFFNKMFCINNLAKNTSNKYLAIYDVDVIVTKKDLTHTIKMLDEGFDFVYPYNGNFLDVPKNQIQNFLTQNEIDISKYRLANPNSVGGCVVFKRDVFNNGGRCNLNFKNCGYDDNEIYSRFLKLGYKVGRTNSPLFHLEHERTHTSTGRNEFDNHNMNEFVRINNMKKEELIVEISKWDL